MTTKEAMDALGVSRKTLYNYAEKGLIRVTKYLIPKVMGQNNWDKSDVLALLGQGLRSKDKEIITYLRVKGNSQEANAKMLEQKARVLQFSAARGVQLDNIYEDRSDSLTTSWGERPGLVNMMEAVLRGEVGAIIIDTKCRLTRFGLEVYDLLFKYHGVKLIIINQVLGDPYYQSEQSDDIAKMLDQAKVDRLGTEPSEA